MKWRKFGDSVNNDISPNTPTIILRKLTSRETENIEGCWKFESTIWGRNRIKMKINLFHH